MDNIPGRLWLIPNLIAPGEPSAALPSSTLSAIRCTRHFVVEGRRAAWRLLSAVLDREALAAADLETLDEHTKPESLAGLLEPAARGEDIGLLSEAGMPCVADPGAPLVALAHDRGMRVIPLPGPSSLFLSLAASGLDGQRFRFLGYLPQSREGRKAALRDIDRGVAADGATRIFIETPYRNDLLLADCIAELSPSVRLCVAASVGSEAERIRSAPVADWRARHDDLGKVPAIFLVGRVPGTSLDRTGPSGDSGRLKARTRRK